MLLFIFELVDQHSNIKTECVKVEKKNMNKDDQITIIILQAVLLLKTIRAYLNAISHAISSISLLPNAGSQLSNAGSQLLNAGS